jgi:hypothetical protein
MRWIVAAVACAACATQPAAPVVAARGGPTLDALAMVGLAEPPRQHERWTPPPGLPPRLAAAVAALFDRGLADPRGLEYHEVELVAADDEAHDAIVRTHAWVFGHFAVAWNGLVYPAAKVGALVSVHADVVQLLAQPEREHLLWSEADAVRFDRPTALKVAMLARIGETAAAVQLRDDSDLARAWIYAASDRAIAAHDRGDHATALQFARFVELVAPGAVAVMPRLIADEPRARPALDLGALPRLAVPARVAALIAHLDEAQMRQTEMFSRTDSVFIPELVTIGAPAVDALIGVIESDPRLTHSAIANVDHLELLGVDDAATQAVDQILHRSFFAAGGRKQLAAQIRTYWTHWRDVSTEERWYLQLADDAAAPNDQVMAALLLTQPSPTGMRGDVLRSHAGTSVSTLLEHRVDAAQDLHDACYLVEAFARWEPGPVAIAAIARVVHRLIADAGTSDRNGYCISDLTKLRAGAGDLAGIDEYAHWIEHMLPDGTTTTLAFAALSQYRTRAPARAAVERMFGAGSPWLPLVTATHDASALVADPLLEVPALNRAALAALADQAAFATLTITEPGRYFVKVTSGGGLEALVRAGGPKVGTVQTVRVCDWIAYRLESSAGTVPAFELYWSEVQRDAAIAALKRWVALQRRDPP